MIWLERPPKITIPPAVELALLHKALAAQPDDPTRRVELGNALLRCGRFADARESLELALQQDPLRFRSYDTLAQCHLALGGPDRALELARQGMSLQPSAQLLFQLGCALNELGRCGEAREAFVRALSLGDAQFDALRALLSPLVRAADGAPLLEFCEALEPRYRNTPLTLAHRAIALSRLGQEEEVRAFVDLNRHVERLAFDPPPEFGGIASFNRRLSDEILDDRCRGEREQDFDVSYEPDSTGHPALSALLAFVRVEVARYVGTLSRRGLQCLLPAPEAASLYAATLILRGDGSNGEHIHRFGYVSTVYHVEVPPSVAQASDGRGDLVLGACDRYTGGYQPCWGRRHIKPQPGWLTIFPSHFHHDVVPSRTRDPRISISSDLRPVRADSSVPGR